MSLRDKVLSIGADSPTDGRKDTGQGITPIGTENGCEGRTEASTAAENRNLQRQADKNEQIREQYKRVIAYYDENIRRAKCNRSTLLKGIQAGESAEEMLLLATSIISDMTGDKVYRDAAQRAIQKSYGLERAV